MEDTPAPRPYRHGNLPNAMRAAARSILDEAGPDGVGLRETARRVGVSATAAYRHFDSKEDLLASVAAEGFRELSAAMRAAVDSREPLIGLGLAYVEFALQKRGLFRLMFGPLLVERGKYPALNEAVNEALGLIQQVVTGEERKAHDENPATLAAWGLVHGLSTLFIDGLVSESQARVMAEKILVRSGPSSRPEAFHAAP
jgi:AcrR family transcriptional regulator